MKVTDTIKYVGVNDHQVDLFEGQYKVPNGMSYNSYVILDEKIADIVEPLWTLISPISGSTISSRYWRTGSRII